MNSYFLDKITKKVPFLKTKRNQNKDQTLELIEKDYKNLNFLFTLLLSFFTYICYELNNLYFSENKNNMQSAKALTITFPCIFFALFFTLFVFIIFSRRRKTNFYLIIVILLQEFFIICLFFSINKIYEGNTQKYLATNISSNNNIANDTNNNTINYSVLYSFDALEIFKNFFVFYIVHAVCFTVFDFQITSTRLAKKIRINTFIWFNIYKSIMFSIFFIKYVKLENCFNKLFQEIIFFGIIILTNLVKYKSNDTMKLKLKNLFNEKNAIIDYYETLTNMLNKSFLSLNLTNKAISMNKSFINLLRKTGIKENENY